MAARLAYHSVAVGESKPPPRARAAPPAISTALNFQVPDFIGIASFGPARARGRAAPMVIGLAGEAVGVFPWRFKEATPRRSLQIIIGIILTLTEFTVQFPNDIG